MRNVAIKSNLKLSEYHLFDKTNNKPIFLKTEKDIFKYLNIPYIHPNRVKDNLIKKKTQLSYHIYILVYII